MHIMGESAQNRTKPGNDKCRIPELHGDGAGRTRSREPHRKPGDSAVLLTMATSTPVLNGLF